jgi:hypothetical protein
MPLPERRSGIFVFADAENSFVKKIIFAADVFSPISSTMHKIIFNFN